LAAGTFSESAESKSVAIFLLVTDRQTDRHYEV
jgi:hypothetical protein